MKIRVNIISAILIILMISTMSYSIITAYSTYRTINLDGVSDVYGRVEDTSGDPLESVEVNCGHRTSYTDKNGEFTIEGVSNGRNTFQFFKEGYVLYRIDRIIYPGNWYAGISRTVSNDLSIDGAIVLSRETIKRNADIDNGPFNASFTFSLTRERSNLVKQARITDNHGRIGYFDLIEGPNSLSIKGKGLYLVRFEEIGSELRIYLSFNGTFNIDETVERLFEGNISEIFSVPRSDLSINISSTIDPGIVYIILSGNHTGTRITMNISSITEMEQPIIIGSLPPDNYSLFLYGKRIIDVSLSIGYHDNNNSWDLDVQLSPAQIEEDLLGLNLELNYLISLFYFTISLLLMIPIIYIKRGRSWTLFISLCFISFLSRDPIDLLPIYYTTILSTVAVLISFTMRDLFMRRERMIRKEKGYGTLRKE